MTNKDDITFRAKEEIRLYAMATQGTVNELVDEIEKLRGLHESSERNRWKNFDLAVERRQDLEALRRYHARNLK